MSNRGNRCFHFDVAQLKTNLVSIFSGIKKREGEMAKTELDATKGSDEPFSIISQFVIEYSIKF